MYTVIGAKSQVSEHENRLTSQHTPVRKKRNQQYFVHNVDKCKCIVVIFGRQSLKNNE